MLEILYFQSHFTSEYLWKCFKNISQEQCQAIEQRLFRPSIYTELLRAIAQEPLSNTVMENNGLYKLLMKSLVSWYPLDALDITLMTGVETPLWIIF